MPVNLSFRRVGITLSGRNQTANKNRKFYWMGATILRVVVPHVKVEERVGKPPVFRKKTKRGTRGHRVGPRKSRSCKVCLTHNCSHLAKAVVTKATHRPPARGLQPTRRQGICGPVSRKLAAPGRFVSWVDRAVNRIGSRLIVEVDGLGWDRWQGTDFNPFNVPWHNCRTRSGLHRFVSCKNAVCSTVLRHRLLTSLEEKKGRPPPPQYIERALCLKYRTWSSAGMFPSEEMQVLSWEINPITGGIAFQTGVEVRKVCVCGREEVVIGPDSQFTPTFVNLTSCPHRRRRRR